MNESRWYPRAAALGWALVGAAACAAMAPLEPSLLEEGYILHAAQRMAHGERLYRDITTFTGPFPFELLALMLRLFGEEIMVARSAVVVLTGAACAAVYGVARRAGAGPFAHAAAASVASAPVLLFSLLSIFFYSTLACYMSLIAGYAGVRATRSLPWAVATGVLVACVAFSKQTIGLALAVSLFVALTALGPVEKRLRPVLAYVLGGVLVAVATLSVYGLRGDLEALWRALVVMPLALGEGFRSPYMNLWPPGELSEIIRPHKNLYLPQLFFLLRDSLRGDIGAPAILLTQFFYALPFLALAATGIRRMFGPLAPAAWIQTAVLLALATNLFPRTDWGHLVYVLPAAVVQFFVLAQASNYRAARQRAAAVATGVFVLALGVSTFAAGKYLYDLSGPPTLGPRVPQRPVSAMYRRPGLPRVIQFLRERAEPDEAIFVARQEPLIYFATETRNPTPFGGVIPGLREEQEGPILEALPQVRYVVMSEIDQPAANYYRDVLPAVQAHLERFFHIPDVFLGENVSWILVLERGADRGATATDLFGIRETAEAWTRDRSGRISPSQVSPPKLGTRHNRRPLAFVLGTWGGGLDFELDLPRDALFQADVGLRFVAGLKVYQHPTQCRVVVSVARADEFEKLGSMGLLYRPYEGRSWSPLEVDLSAYGGEHVTLRLELIPDAPLRSGAVAWWGSPRIVRRPSVNDE